MFFKQFRGKPNVFREFYQQREIRQFRSSHTMIQFFKEV